VGFEGHDETVAVGAAADGHSVYRGFRKDEKMPLTVPWSVAWSSAIARGQGPAFGVGACIDRRHGALIHPNEAGGARGWCPRSKVSMTIMRPPQHGHGRSGGEGSKVGSF